MKNLDFLQRTREKETHTFLTRASADVLVTKYECITLYGWIPLAALKLFKCMQPWSLISGWQEHANTTTRPPPSFPPPTLFSPRLWMLDDAVDNPRPSFAMARIRRTKWFFDNDGNDVRGGTHCWPWQQCVYCWHGKKSGPRENEKEHKDRLNFLLPSACENAISPIAHIKRHTAKGKEKSKRNE